METHHQENTTPPPSSSASSPSPSHEFTFAISLDPTAAKIPDNNNKSKSSSSHQTSSAAIDLSPADDIFFHGHLLPLRHLTSDAALPLVSPRSSTNSLDNFTLPAKDHRHHHRHQQACSFQEEKRGGCSLQERGGTVKEKSKSFSVFWNRKKAPSRSNDDDDCRGQKRKSKFEMLKGYFRSFKPFDSLRNSGKSDSNGKNNDINNSRPYSLSSGKLLQGGSRGGESRGRQRGDLFSAPASMKASPTNSGRLNLATSSGTISPINTKNDSTMEELQAAIQAAIAHCKKSIAANTEDAIITCE